jgi:hypothetical protein
MARHMELRRPRECVVESLVVKNCCKRALAIIALSTDSNMVFADQMTEFAKSLVASRYMHLVIRVIVQGMQLNME